MPPRLRVLVTVVLIGALGLLGVALVWVFGMRDKQSRVVAAQRRVNRAVVNPRQLATAGTPGAYAAVVRHTGRTSGRAYRTPVVALPTEDGFVVALVYGPGSDWVRNVLATGSAVVEHEGASYAVDRPEVVPVSAVREVFSAGDRRGQALLGVTQALRLRHAGNGDGPRPIDAGQDGQDSQAGQV